MPLSCKSVKTCQLYASLPNEQQSAVFDAAPPNYRKCILATNIAETSLTIPGVKYVIDCGKQKEKRHVTRATGAGTYLREYPLPQRCPNPGSQVSTLS